MSESHLYAGFRYAGALASVRGQRSIQRDVMRGLEVRSLLVVGCAYGEELEEVLDTMPLEQLHITAIDLAEVQEQLRSRSFARRLGNRLEWKREDVLRMHSVLGFGSFEIVQCSFVLHDIRYEDKDRAVITLCDAVQPHGILIISDIFVSSNRDLRSETVEIYDRFLAEAGESLSAGLLTYPEWLSLVGDGVAPGLLRTKEEAIRGGRDFFEPLEVLTKRFLSTGCSVVKILRNSVNERLSVVVLRRGRPQERTC